MEKGEAQKLKLKLCMLCMYTCIHVCAYAGMLVCGVYVYVFLDHVLPYFVR